MYKYIIQGAGAVGSAVGGSLAKAGFEVTLVSRKPHVEAIREQNGLYMHTLKGIELQPIQAVENISELEMTDDTIIIQTMKANDTEASLDDLKDIDKNVPIVCFQNGVDNEAIVSKMFSRVYGGVTRFTATMMKPGETQFAGTGKIILGPYPAGMDAVAEQIVHDLAQTGYTCLTTDNIMQDKWLKLLVNLISCIKPMTIKAGDEQELRVIVCRHVMREGIEVLNKAGIKAESTNGTEDSADKMLHKFDDALALAEGVGQGMPLLNSTWQSLAKHKKVLENDWYTGKIIEIGEKVGVSFARSMAPVTISTRSASPASIFLAIPWQVSRGSPTLKALRKNIRAKDSAITHRIPAPIMERGACSRELPEPKFRPAIMMPFPSVFPWRSSIISVRQCLPSSSTSLIARYRAGMIKSVSMLSPSR